VTPSKAPNGAGTVWQRPNGRWAGAVVLLEADGVRRRRTFYAVTREEAEAKRAELLAKAERGVPITPSQLTLQGYLDEWLSQVVSDRVRPNTLTAYRHYVERYLNTDLGKKKLGRLSAREVRLYLDSLKRRGTGVRTIRYVHATLRAALEDAMREELIEKNVAKLVRPPAATRIEHHPLSVEETKLFLKSNHDDRLFALFLVIALLGLRRSEVLGLQWGDVDLAGGALTVQRGLHRVNGKLVTMATKTRRSRRTIPLPALVVAALERHRVQQVQERADLGLPWQESGHVFTTAVGTPLDPDNTTKLVKRALKTAGVRDVRMHDFRHGCVSVLIGLGVPPRTVMEIAGHSGLEMTMNVYAHVSLEDKQAAVDKLNALFEEGS